MRDVKKKKIKKASKLIERELMLPLTTLIYKIEK